MTQSPTDQCIVLPFRADKRQPFNGTGLALHFLVGNVLVLHTGLKEMWFGWRVKKIFPQMTTFQRYCRDGTAELDLVQVSRSQQVRFWIYGSHTEKDARLHFFDAQTPHSVSPSADLAITIDDGLIGFRTQLLTWLAAAGRTMPKEQALAALWPESISPEGLDAVGQALEKFYIHSAYGGDGPLDGFPFEKAVSAAPESFLAQDLYGWALYRNQNYKAARNAFLTSLRINPAGAGAMSGLMWCGVYGKDLDEAMFWSGRKADVCRQDIQSACEEGRQRYTKVNK
ncbi:tetratricopeptide repeat protein [Desulfosarcina sp.]|uniref:tetratricopeptide repeat protein n=1 Tax=Desulfosarcina sp. TaxID=2027861 RepID=UPI003970B515